MNLPNGYTSRPATSAGAHTIARHRYPAQADAPERPVYAEWVQGALAQGRYTGLLVLSSEAVVAGAGLVRLDWWPTRHNPTAVRARLVNVWTEPECRRQGLARSLTQMLLEQARAQDIGTVSLSTTAQGRPLYERLGFKAYPHEMLLELGP